MFVSKESPDTQVHCHGMTSNCSVLVSRTVPRSPTGSWVISDRSMAGPRLVCAWRDLLAICARVFGSPCVCVCVCVCV